MIACTSTIFVFYLLLYVNCNCLLFKVQKTYDDSSFRSIVILCSPPLEGGCKEVQDVYTTFAKLNKIIKVSNTSFFLGNLHFFEVILILIFLLGCLHF